MSNPDSNTASSPTFNTAFEHLRAEALEVGYERFTAPEYRPHRVRHVVLLQCRAGLDAATRAAVVDRFLALERECVRDRQPYIESIEYGRQCGGEGAERGFELCFLVTFRSEGDRNYYTGTPIVTDPAYCDAVHEAFKAFVGPLLAPEGVLVFDYLPRTRAAG
jgi:hypothetical protein